MIEKHEPVVEAQIEKIPPAEFDMALREKLVEEAQEAINADDANLITELADIQEVRLDLMLFV